MAIHKVDQDPTELSLVSSFTHDALHRKQDLLEFVYALQTTQGGCSVFLCSPWGNGKTFFVKTARLILKRLNAQLDAVGSSAIDALIEPSMREQADINPIVPFYFNAWENDLYDEPLAALFASMAAEFDLLTNEGSSRELISSLGSVIDSILNANSLPALVKPAMNAIGSLKGTDVIDSYKKRYELKDAISNGLDQIKIETANTIVVFIDELDRCRPEFALRLLEQTKHFLTRDDVILVYSVDLEQLAELIRGFYGQGFDGYRYLEKFYDTIIELRDPDSRKYVEQSNLLDTYSSYDCMVSDILSSNRPTPRRCNRLIPIFQQMRGKAIDGPIRYASDFAKTILTPLFLSIKVDDPALWHNIRDGKCLDKLYEIGTQYSTFNEVLDQCLRGTPYLPRDREPGKEECKLYVIDLCTLIFEDDKRSERYSKAANRMGEKWGNFDSHYFKTLQFL